jgi:hypothetical protein
MVKKMPATARAAARRTVRTDVVTRVSAHNISHRAYELFQKRGCEHGHDLDDWLRAEAALLAGQDSGVGPPSVASRRRLS